MALDVEEVVDSRMDGEESLRGRRRFEPTKVYEHVTGGVGEVGSAAVKT